MNRTQKSAWFGLVVPCFPVGWYFCVATLTQNLLLTIVPIVVFLLIVPVAMYVLIGKKQGLAEVASDERDCMIRSKALLAGFISVFVMLVIMCSVMILASNDETLVNAYISIPLSVLTYLIAIAAYSAAILIQYKTEGANHE